MDGLFSILGDYGLVIVIVGFSLGFISLLVITGIYAWKTYKYINTINCLVWTEGAYTDNGEDQLRMETKKIQVPENSGTWDYRHVWWQWWPRWVHWLEDTDGKGTYQDFIPDHHIDTSITSSKLAKDIDWTESKAVYKFKTAILEKAAYGAPILLGLASLGATFMLAFLLAGD